MENECSLCDGTGKYGDVETGLPATNKDCENCNGTGLGGSRLMIFSICLTYDEIRDMRDNNETIVKYINGDEYHVQMSSDEHEENQ